MNLEGIIKTEVNAGYDGKTKIFKPINFMLCESCFWCASSLSSSLLYHFSDNDTVSNCPICNKHSLKLIPIASISLLQKAGCSK
jgi:hypothetical protein